MDSISIAQMKDWTSIIEAPKQEQVLQKRGETAGLDLLGARADMESFIAQTGSNILNETYLLSLSANILLFHSSS
jgi:hypothetical protein